MPTVEEALQTGWQRHQAGELRQAESIYRQVLAAAPNNANAWCFLGMTCHDQQRYDEAIQAYQTAVRLQPNFPIALSNMGNTLKQQGQLAEAEASCRAAIRLKPDYSTAHNNLGVALVAQGRLEEAEAIFQRAIDLMPTDAVALANRGAALVRQGKFDQATADVERALRINPNYAEAHKNQGIVHLLLGDFERGWREYEWRWRCPGMKPRSFAAPPWDGSDLAGRTILLHNEQGLGDTIQFVRYAKVLRERGARVLALCQKPLAPILATYRHLDGLYQSESALPPFDCHAAMMSVPGLVGTNWTNLPADVPYLFADESLVAKWRERLAAHGPAFRVGIVWQGSPDFHADRQRSAPLEHFRHLANVPGVRLFSLQKNHGLDQLRRHQQEFRIVDFGDELDRDTGPFLDTAAVLKNLDLLICSDTSVPHLAGALGTPTWMAISISPDWRWFLNRDDSPWYPTLRLFRQQQLGDWDDVFRRLAAALRQRLDQPTTLAPPSAATVSVEIPAGELIDKITILEIKAVRISDAAKLANIRNELATLAAARDAHLPTSDELATLTQQLRLVNEQLWDIEDEIRDCERQHDFGNRFIELARSVYKSNDRRAALKRQINELLGSRLLEEKSYAAY